MSIRSDVRSTDIIGTPDYGKPCRQNVTRCINVAVVDNPAFWASPFPNTQWQLILDVTTVPTAGGVNDLLVC